ncbi:MAG: hypothetical protein Q7J36_07235 [Thiobacillus sp.]|nr:hypothetical protein [Thiobacillus sp.]
MNARVSTVGNHPSPALQGRPASLVQAVFAVLLLSATAIESVRASVPVPKHLIDPGLPRIEDPGKLVDRFLQAVDRGELTVFGQTIARAMIVPVRIEYVYELADRAMRIKIYSNLNAPLPVPGQDDCRILGVSAVMEDGSITEIESHVWMK